MTNKLILCFDFDDTLIDDSYKFELTFCDCIKVILESFETRPPQIDEILQLARKLDNEKLANWESALRYTPERLLSTWLETYRKLSQSRLVEIKKHTELILEGLVRKNYDPPYYIIPGAIETLNTFTEKNYEMHLITIGSYEIQNKKIVHTGLEKFFTEVHIVTNGDKTETIKSIVSKYGEDNVIMIGNSIRSDINPALNAKARAIYIPRGSWHLFNAEPINDTYITISSITQVISVIENLI